MELGIMFTWFGFITCLERCRDKSRHSTHEGVRYDIAMRILAGLLLAALTLSAQDSAETHLATAKAAAGTDWVNLFNFQCYGPGPGGQRPVPGAPPPAPRTAG